MSNTATDLLSSIGVQSNEKKVQEMAGAVTRLIVNQALREAKEQAKVRDSTTRPQTPRKMGNSV